MGHALPGGWSFPGEVVEGILTGFADDTKLGGSLDTAGAGLPSRGI